MKKLVLLAGLAFVTAGAVAQNADSYIVKTKGVKKVETTKTTAKADEVNNPDAEEATDFIGRNFPTYGLCDWKPGMKFMVLPEKYDLLVNTFRDKQTDKEVSSGSLRRKIMVYAGHSVASNGRTRMDFTCQEDNRQYYFELPNGSFDDYCYSKLGVPTLAYLGDVDVARTLLMGKTLLTTATEYRVDVDYESDSFEKVKMEKGKPVKVVAIGVGTRSFPVKIIVETKDGKEFYQNVAISKTNCGMRDEEFGVDNAKHLFYGSFLPQDEIRHEEASDTEFGKYMSKTVHLKLPTALNVERNGSGRVLTMPKETTFTIVTIKKEANSQYAILSLKEVNTGRMYAKRVIFRVEDAVPNQGDKRGDYFDEIFEMGQGKVQANPYRKVKRGRR